MPWTFFGGYKIYTITPYITIYNNLLKCITNELKIPWNILKSFKMYIEYGKIKPGISYKNVLRLRSPIALYSTPLSSTIYTHLIHNHIYKLSNNIQ
jgi:hypothetical protein